MGSGSGMSSLWCLVPTCGLVVLAVSVFVSARRGWQRGTGAILGTIAWMLPSTLALAALIVLSLFGWYQSSSAAYFVALVGIITAAGVATLFRERARRAFERYGDHRRVLLCYFRDLVLLIIAILVASFSIESPWNEFLRFFEPWKLLLNIAPVAAVFISLYFIGQRRGWVLALVSVAAALIGLAQYFVTLFKSAAIIPSDLYAIGTALSVSGGYEFVVGAKQVLCIALTCCVVALLSCMQPPLTRVAKAGSPSALLKNLAPIVGRTLCGLLVLGASFQAIRSVNFSDEFDFARSYWDSLTTYETQGFVASFISLYQNSIIVEPEGYSTGDAARLTDEYAQDYLEQRGSSSERQAAVSQFDEQKPTVIAIMNESFSDLSVFEGLQAGYQGPEFAKNIPDALYTGYVYASVCGGGTCNSEFEFLTGAALAYIGAENQVYITHDLSELSSLPKSLEACGYSSTAIHPMPGANWNRDVAYPALGFDSFLDQDAFSDDDPYRHAGRTDAATYEVILEVLRKSEEPQFIFDITMQNHGGYGAWDLPEEERLDLDLSWMDDDLEATLTEYLALISTSDRELEEFIAELREIDRPIVLVFFGDHQPATDLDVATYGEPEAGDVEWYERSYCTTYMIWANYDVAGNEQVSERRDIGLFSLQSVLLDSIGAPLSDQQMATLGFLDQVPIMNVIGYRTSDGAWHSLEDEESWDRAVRDLEWIQYLEFGRKL